MVPAMLTDRYFFQIMVTRARIEVFRFEAKVKDQVPAREATSLLMRRACIAPRVGICAQMEGTSDVVFIYVVVIWRRVSNNLEHIPVCLPENPENMCCAMRWS